MTQPESRNVRRIAAAAGTLAAIGLATPFVVAVLVPGLPIALGAVAYHEWKLRRA
jgi:4-amino-4-deoxy-L-arabinose transferase-like glycosyltransferase